MESMLVGPAIDSEGELRGVIQLVNKVNGDGVSEQDIIEV